MATLRPGLRRGGGGGGLDECLKGAWGEGEQGVALAWSWAHELMLRNRCFS